MASSSKTLVLYQREISPRAGYIPARRATLLPNIKGAIATAEQLTMYGYRAYVIVAAAIDLDSCQAVVDKGVGFVAMPIKIAKLPAVDIHRIYPK